MMRELNLNELNEVYGGVTVSKAAVKAGAKILGRALLSGIAIGSGVGALIALGAIVYDVYHISKN
jgi:hypothetical protein